MRREESHAWPATLSTGAVKTIACLILTYTGYYFCRTDFSVCLPVLRSSSNNEFGHAASGATLSVGYAAYAVGKIISGYTVQRVGAYYVLHGFLLVSVLVTVVISMNTLSTQADVKMFMILWGINRLFQSGGWPATLFYIRSVFPPELHGRVLGFTSLSYSLGDAVIRMFLGKLLIAGITWNKLFLVSAASSALLAVPSALYISRRNLGAMTTDVPYTALNGLTAQFWLLLVQSPLFVWTRELFLSWSVPLLHDVFYDGNSGHATMISALLPLLGAASCVLGGIVIDKYTEKRSKIYVLLVVVTALVTGFLGIAVKNRNLSAFVVLLALQSFFSTAPASWAEGLFLFSVSHPRHSGLVLGAVHFSGSLGAMLCGYPIGQLVATRGWVPVMGLAGLVSVINATLSLIYWSLDP